MKLTAVILVLAVGVLAACAQAPDAGAPPSSPDPDQPVTSDMVRPVGGDLREGETWHLLGASISSVQVPGDVTLVFADGRAGGQAPVNTYSAPYTAGADGSLALGPISSTRKAGPDAAMRAESAYLALLETVDGYTTVEAGELYLFDGQMQVLTYSTSPAPQNATEVTDEALALAASVVGRSEADARGAVEDAGYAFRVIERDGEHLAVTEDYSTRRVNVAIADGTVTGATIG